MSGTETILLIVLGFALGGLASLFIGRIMLATAVKMGVRRVQRQVPSSLVGLQTERDRLRAEYAMLAQRLGSRLEEAKLRLAEQTAEVSRHRNRLHGVETSELARMTEMRQLRARLKTAEQALEETKAREATLQQVLAEREEALAKLRKKKGYEGRERPKPATATPTPDAPEAEDPELRLRQRIEKLTELAKPKSARTPAPPPPVSEPEAEEIISAKLAESERQTRELEAELQKLDAEWPAAEHRSPAADAPPPDTQDDNVILLPNRPRDVKSGSSSSHS